MADQQNFDPEGQDHPEWVDYEGSEPVPLAGAIRHGLIISSTFPAFLVMAIFFAFRWVLISGDRAGSFRSTAIVFAAVGLVLGAVNIAIRRHLADESHD